MKKMTIKEFADFSLAKSGSSHAVFLYDSSNQNRNKCADFDFTLLFDQVEYSLAPNRLVFLNSDHSARLQISRVKNILVHDRRPGIGTIVEVICGSKKKERDSQETFRFIIEK